MDRHTRPVPDDCEHNRGAKKARWIAPDEIKNDLLEKVLERRRQLNNYLFMHCDGMYVDSVIKITHRCLGTNQEDRSGFELMSHLFDTDIYHDLAIFMARNGVVSRHRKLYNPEKFIERTIALGALQNAQLLLELGADPCVFLIYPTVVHNRVADVYMYAPTAFAREGAAQALALLLNHGANPNIIRKQENPLYNCILSRHRNARDIVNILLYYGADPQLKLKHEKGQFHESTPLELAATQWRYNPFSNQARDVYELCLNGRQRALDRMAHYLWRVINGGEKARAHACREFPLELCYHIAQFNYGNSERTRFLDQLKEPSWKKWEAKRKTHLE